MLVLLQQAVRLADLITKQGVSPLSIAPILALALPALVVTIFPVCSLMASAITLSRLAADGDLLAFGPRAIASINSSPRSWAWECLWGS